MLLNSISQYHNNLTLNVLLFGEALLSDDVNTLIFETVQKYIIDTKRFWIMFFQTALLCGT